MPDSMTSERERRTRIDHLDAESLTRVVGQLGHEVGTPLGSILLMAEMLGGVLESLDADEHHVKRADDVRLAALDVRAAVQGFVHLLRLETGWISPKAGRLDVTHLVEDLAEKARETAAGLEVTSSLGTAEGRLPERMETDPGFVQEIAAHLFVWHGARGGEGALRIVGTEDGLLLAFRSEGAGIPWDEDAVLRPLDAGDLQPARHHGGGGLELARVRSLAWRLGGEVSGRNEDGAAIVEARVPEGGEDPLA